ncbi:MAG: AraC family transcriptional regulator [Deltaproteobacteria bacterium]|nr:AraC family transcriptional regulator [Deltaproteobacteria bacterium]
MTAPLKPQLRPARGIVAGPGRGQPPGPIHHQRVLPPPELVALVEHLWLVRWEFPPGATFEAITLPHPVAHWTVEGDESVVRGVSQRPFARTLSGAGRVVAVKFRPAGLRWLTELPAKHSRERLLPAAELLGLRPAPLSGLPDDEALAALAATLTELPQRDVPDAQLARDLAERCATDRSITTVEALAAVAGVGVRGLQRLFEREIGLPPKWVIQRYRLHEAVEGLVDPSRRDLAELAYTLGFVDQAHFSRAYRAAVGEPPSATLARLRTAPGRAS